uniref:Uncharacterized protein n=2 Tax=Enterobacterales TaxID=91347 RepID=A0A345WXR0_KLEOX|nr:hypothetical protein [Klebsiella aerogenes]AXJ98463.1 hypothetical protein [Klebsiella oxytoca]QAX89293.1 hypothetical protein SGI1-PmCA46_034 [Proteus mirabilis]QKY82385.1 hypothetical protein [Escherichia coli]SPN81073.1 hypothetical protein PCNR132_026 [Klebsiella pneumoniae]
MSNYVLSASNAAINGDRVARLLRIKWRSHAQQARNLWRPV